LEIEIEKTQGLNSIFDQLSKANIKVLSMRNKANRLEELFVSIVREEER
jgi:ABC-2 type transport system ATP-binding protein